MPIFFFKIPLFDIFASQGLHTESAGVPKLAQVAAKFDGVMHVRLCVHALLRQCPQVFSV